MKKTDLHIHSSYSDDGEFSPHQLVKMCKEAGIERMAIADHNTVRGCKEAIKAAKAEGIQCIPAIEIDCVWNDMDFHVLGYGIDIDSEDFARIESNVREQRVQASKEMLIKTQKMGWEVSEDEMQKLSESSYWKLCWTGEMFAEVLLGKEEYRDHELLMPYREGGERSDNPCVNFYWDYYSRGRRCYVAIQYPSLEHIVDIIHNSGGYAVLAHPGVNLKGKEHYLEEIVSLGLDGVEVYSSYHTKAQVDYFYREAQRLGLQMTCGSDFHGKIKPSVRLGEMT